LSPSSDQQGETSMEEAAEAMGTLKTSLLNWMTKLVGKVMEPKVKDTFWWVQTVSSNIRRLF